MVKCPRCRSTDTEFKGWAYGEELYTCNDCHCAWTQPEGKGDDE